jgi:hypothetical protein
MTRRARRIADEHGDQSFPETMELGRNMNVPLSTLRDYATDHALVYYYVVASIRNLDGEFIQIGCGPNFQGGRITLCTCKHRMRTCMDVEEWKGAWIAGFTGVSAWEGRNFLVYLMQVERAFASHRDLWLSTALSSETKRAKAAHLDRFGDVFKPRGKTMAPRDPKSYLPPCGDHRHVRGWEKDVSYEGYSGRPAALLVGDPARSFLWNRPSFYYGGTLGRGHRRCTLGSLLAQLKTGETR